MYPLDNPNSQFVLEARRDVRDSLLNDLVKISDVLQHEVGLGPAAVWAIDRLSVAGSRVAVRDLSQWYFRMLDLLESRDMASVVDHFESLAEVLAIPAAVRLDAGATIEVPARQTDGFVRLPQLSEPLRRANGHDSFRVNAQGIDLHDDIEYRWSELMLETQLRVDDLLFLCAGLGLRQAVESQGDPQNAGSSDSLALRSISREELLGERRRLDSMAAAMGILGLVWDDLLQEVRASTDAYALIRGPHLVGGTDMRYAGVTFLNMGNANSPIAYLDHVAHEATHNTLFFATELDPLVANPRQEAESPIRRTRRPILGTVHATMVFYRLVRLFERALDFGDLSEHHAELEARVHLHAIGLIAGAEIVGNVAELTPTGIDWFEAIQAEAGRVQRDLRPSLAKAALVGPDYDPVEVSSAASRPTR
jgi:HEXXH motif-containing protein